MNRILVLTTAALLACLPVAHAGRAGEISTLSDEWQKTKSGERVKIIRVEVRRRDRNARQIIRLAVQAKDKKGTVLFAQVSSSGGTTRTRSSDSMLTAIWTFKVDTGDMHNPSISYEATLIDETTKEVIDARNRGIRNRAAWEKENTGAEKLDLRQFIDSPFSRRGI